MSFFGRGRQQQPMDNIGQTAANVEKILQAAGIAIENARLPIEGLGWTFNQGSAVIEIYISPKDDKYYFQVLSPIMYIPQTGLLAFYRRLLEMNMVIANLTLGVFGETVYVFHERPLDGLDITEVGDIIASVAQNADAYDNTLVNEFGGRLYSGI